MQLNVAKLEGEVAKLKAEAYKIQMEAGAIPEELQLKLAELEMKTQLEREGFETSARLALETSQSALERIQMQGAHAKQAELLKAQIAARLPQLRK